MILPQGKSLKHGGTEVAEEKGFCRRFARMNADQEKQTHRGGAETRRRGEEEKLTTDLHG
jgi:hypothetical protein